MVTCFKNPRAVLSEAFRALSPGGYIELRDPILPFLFMTPPPADCALKEWCDKLMEAAQRAGRDWGVATKYAQLLSELGFVDITERREAIALSPWVKGKQNKHLSLLLQHDVLNMLEPVCMALFTRVLGWEQGRVLEFLVKVRRDVQNTDVHAYSEGFVSFFFPFFFLSRFQCWFNGPASYTDIHDRVHIYARKPYLTPPPEASR